MDESRLRGVALGKKMYSFLYTFNIIMGVNFLWFHLVFWWAYKMYFVTKASHIILVIFQIKINFQQNVFLQHTYAYLNEKHVNTLFVKSHESNFSIVIEMVQLTHIQYIIKYFIKFCNYLNHFKSIFTLCNILLHVSFFHKYIIYSFNINKKM
jgi:hypothetical protein